jgi:2-keto-4-pentenoate hydratase/2-oxohepta-3-ene-1,7-dioic acid hydratase in catechol pathway
MWEIVDCPPMGLVRFRTDTSSICPGYLLEDGIVDLTTLSIPGVETTETTAYLGVLAEGKQLYDIMVPEEGAVHAVETVAFEVPTPVRSLVRLDCTYEHDQTDSGYNPHVEEPHLDELDTPSLWIGSNVSLTVDGSEIPLPREAADVRPGVELGFVVGKAASSVPVEDAMDIVAGCIACGSLTVYDEIPSLEGYRMYEGFVPCGPVVTPRTALDFEDLKLRVAINGDQADVRTTDQLRFSPAELVSYTSKVTSLEPGDLVLSGDPTRINRSLSTGDQISASVQDVGTVSADIVPEGQP